MSWFTRLALAPAFLLGACGGTTVEHGGSGGSGGDGGGSAGMVGESGGVDGSGANVGSGGVAGSGGKVGAGGTVGTGGKVGSGGVAGSGGKVATGGTGIGGSVSREPLNHRASVKICGMPPTSSGGAPAGPSPPPEACMTDMDCNTGPNGRCLGSRIGLTCSYDECFNDAGCAQAEVCACATGGRGSHCLAPGCQVDSDCPGSFCSPTFGSCGTYSGVIAYQCHTQKDQCVNDADCTSGDPSTSTAGAYCMYDPMVAHWVCSSSQCAG